MRYKWRICKGKKMILIGRYLSPFVRRAATTLHLYGIPYEHHPLQHTGDDAAELRTRNPVGRVPALIINDGQVLVDSSTIIDYLDREVGPEQTLTPLEGVERNQVLNLLSIATGSIEKAISTVYEVRFRPEEKRHAPWVERCADQARGGLTYLESQLTDDWFLGSRMTQVDVTTAIGWQFMEIAAKDFLATVEAPRLSALSERMKKLDAFKNTHPG